MINEESKQKNLHDLLISKSTSSSDSARNDANKDRRQVEVIKKFSNQLHSEQASNKKNLFVESRQFASNAQENEDSDNEIDAIMLETSEALKSNDFRQTIYKTVEQYLRALMSNSKNVTAKTRVNRLNEQIKEQNIKDNFFKKNLDKFLINIFTFIVHFELIKIFYKFLLKNSNDENARKKLIDINKILNEINKQNDYLEIWVMNISLRIVDVIDEASAQVDVKVKVDICISNESNDLTSLERIVIVKKIEYDSRVIMNRDTQKNSLFEIYLEADFEKEIVKEWLESRDSIKNLSSNTKIKHMKIYEHVKIRDEHRTSQFYLIKIEDDDYIVSRLTLFKKKDFSSSKLQRIDSLLDSQNAQLRYELDLCREKNEHSDIEEQLTDVDIEQISCLSSYKMSKSENENSKIRNENKNIDYLIFRKKDLKRDLKSKINSETSSQFWISIVKKIEERMKIQAYSEKFVHFL